MGEVDLNAGTDCFALIDRYPQFDRIRVTDRVAIFDPSFTVDVIFKTDRIVNIFSQDFFPAGIIVEKSKSKQPVS